MKRGLLATRQELSQLQQSFGRQPFDAFYDRLHRRCSLILQASPIKEDIWRRTWSHGYWAAALEAARAIQGRILDLLIAHHIEPNYAYRDRAIEELRTLIGWSTWVDPCHEDLRVDLCTAEAAVAATVGLDWLWEDLTEADRLRVLRAIRKKVIEPYHKSIRENVWWYGCYHNWNAVVNSGCGMAALALSDEEPAAEKAYRLAVEGLGHFFDGLGREGGWDEGTGYWGYAMRYVLLLGEAMARVMDDQQLLHHRGMDTTGLFPIYFTPNGHATSFGDAAIPPLHGTLYLLVKHFGLKEVAWWLDTYAFHRDVGTDGWSAAGLALLFRPTDLEAPIVPDIDTMKVFNEIGWAAMADQWPRPTMYVAAKTGDLSANHSQHDMNSIQFQVDGEVLLADVGAGWYSREYFGERRSEFYEVQARAHNTMVVDGRDFSIDARGSIVDALQENNYRWIACDARDACGQNVKFIRHLVLVVDPAKSQGRMLIVLDELANTARERVDLYWHTPGRIELNDKTRRGTFTGSRAALHVAFLADTSVSVSVGSENLKGRRADHFVCVTAPGVEAAKFLSVFSRQRFKTVPKMTANSHSLTVTVGDVQVRFRARKAHLTLEGVTTR